MISARRFAFVLGALLTGLASGCGSDSHPDFKVGGLYSVKDGNSGFKIAKVLIVEDHAVHIRVYKNAFPSRPATVDPSALTLGTINDKDGFGVGHLPLTCEGFGAWEPVLLMEQPVSPAELEGYKLWKEGR